MRKPIVIALAIFTSLLAGRVAVAAANRELEAKIQRVESGLLPETASGTKPERMTLSARMGHYHVPAVSIAVVNGGRIEWARGYGELQAGGGKKVDSDTLFQAASISKPVAAMTAMRLVELGKLSLDEDVNIKLRSWKVPDNEFTKTQKVTLRRLLSHTAGVTVHGFRGYAANEPVPALLQVLDGVKPANSPPIRVDIVPGTEWRYSGGGYVIVQQLIEDVTGKPFAEVANELVIRPLGMTRSAYQQPLSDALASNAAHAHDGDGRPIEGRWHTYPERTAAGLWTTPSDLARVILAMQTPGKALQPKSADEMLNVVRDKYGLGFGVEATAGARSFSHGGANEGFRCMLFGYRDSGRGAVVMTNGDAGGALAAEVLRAISAEYGWPGYKTK